MKRRGGNLLRLLFFILIITLTIVNGEKTKRVGDSMVVFVEDEKDNLQNKNKESESVSISSGRFIDGFALCTDNTVLLNDTSNSIRFWFETIASNRKIVSSAFTNNANDDVLASDWIKLDGIEEISLELQGFQGKVVNVKTQQKVSATQQQRFQQTKVRVKWTVCKFEVDEVLPMQLLFAFGSILSMIIFVTIILDSRNKRLDKFS
jgi:hypothetical protein